MGCGALNGSTPIFSFLNRGNYWGVDPNSWLRTLRTVKSPLTLFLRIIKRPHFSSNAQFIPCDSPSDIDFVFAHSVLSHTSLDQLQQFFESSSRLLRLGGLVVASYRDIIPNNFGSNGSPNDAGKVYSEWAYPGNTYFSFETIKTIATDLGCAVELMPKFTKMMTNCRASEFHDWFVAKKIRNIVS